MTHIIVMISRFTMIILFAIYTYDCFAALRTTSEKRQQSLYRKQTSLNFLFLTNAFSVMYLVQQDVKLLALYLMLLVFLFGTELIFNKIYRHGSKSLVNNMCMLLSISFVILSRLDPDKAVKQFMIACASLAITCLIPLLVSKLKFLNRLAWVYAVVGIAGLALVAVAGARVYGAKLNINIGGIAIQPSEFIKILFVFFAAAMLSEAMQCQGQEKIKKLIITSAVAALHVLILIASRDLGGAGIFYITYLCMFYAATKKKGLFILGGLAVFFGVAAAYFVMSHVKTRVIAWLDPLSVADDAGYQVCQSLFAIGTGGWFGSGLYQGMPEKIPVVAQDFVFSAISEEMGGLFALCLILVCISCFMMFFNIAMQIRDPFYKLVALGLGTVYSTQVFLTIGGVTKFIPSTGVTLPLVSYGGSSLLSTMILFAVIQGLYARYSDQAEKKVKAMAAAKEIEQKTGRRVRK